MDHVRETIENPSIAVRMQDGAVYFYRLGYGTGNRVNCYLRVIVRYDALNEGAVRTMWFTPVIEEGEEYLCWNVS